MPNHTQPNRDTSETGPPSSITITLIAAVAANGVIGDSGEIPWYYPEDLAHFKEATTGHPVIMGRKTFESIRSRLGEPLPERTTVVLSRQPNIDTGSRVIHAQNLEDAFAEAAADAQVRGVDDVYVAGGGTVYEAALPYAEQMILTEVNDPYPGNVEFPSWDAQEWEVVERESHDNFSFVTYQRQSPE